MPEDAEQSDRSAWIGHVLPDVYDGISIWEKPDGTLINRWSGVLSDNPGDRTLQRRHRMAQEQIEQILRQREEQST